MAMSFYLLVWFDLAEDVRPEPRVPAEGGGLVTDLLGQLLGRHHHHRAVAAVTRLLQLQQSQVRIRIV